MYHPIVRALHWLMAALIFANGALAWLADDMERPLKGTLFFWHKSIGVLLLLLVVVRIVMIRKHSAPPYPESVSVRDVRVHKIVSHLLYLLMLVVPVAGYLLVDAAGGSASLFGLFSLPDLLAKNHEVHEFFEELHVILAWFLISLAALHAAAGLRHKRLQDGIFERMWPTKSASENRLDDV